LRIENQHIPSGPTIKDEVANFAFWVGVMEAMPDHYHKVKASTDFKSIRQNFYKAAKLGLGCQFKWCGELITKKRLILDKFIPMTYDGPAKASIDNKEAAQYLDIIYQRVEKEKLVLPGWSRTLTRSNSIQPIEGPPSTLRGKCSPYRKKTFQYMNGRTSKRIIDLRRFTIIP